MINKFFKNTTIFALNQAKCFNIKNRPNNYVESLKFIKFSFSNSKKL
jgi:hypothetical protein